ncbi:hypothetical protein [Butyricimonas synergistica]|uniref:hypothetical protein n=1 Tax=Butyricimonas synergistica TaxID=544644 RepID=UPI0003AB15D2|nr:hypothetical protein [Butyricimonas synergistica]
MKKHIINRMKDIVKNENTTVSQDFEADKKDLKSYNGNFLWGYSSKGTNLICYNAPFSYLQVERVKDTKNCYVCVGGKLRKVSREKAKAIAVGLYSRNHCA